MGPDGEGAWRRTQGEARGAGRGRAVGKEGGEGAGARSVQQSGGEGVAGPARVRERVQVRVRGWRWWWKEEKDGEGHLDRVKLGTSGGQSTPRRKRNSTDPSRQAPNHWPPTPSRSHSLSNSPSRAHLRAGPFSRTRPRRRAPRARRARWRGRCGRGRAGRAGRVGACVPCHGRGLESAPGTWAAVVGTPRRPCLERHRRPSGHSPDPIAALACPAPPSPSVLARHTLRLARPLAACAEPTPSRSALRAVQRCRARRFSRTPLR